MSSPCLIVAHRGASAELPENTLEAFSKAFHEYQADMIEFDVGYSKDRVPIVIHDATVQRTTNAKGSLQNLTLQALKKLDAGYRFQLPGKKGYPCRGQGIQIPTFEELLTTYPKNKLFVEIKETSESLVHDVMKLIDKYQARTRVIMTSKYHIVFKTMLCDYPDVPRSMSHTELKKVYLGYRSKRGYKMAAGKQIASMPLKAYGLKLDTPEWIRFLKKNGVDVYYWTINNPETARRLVRDGADGIVTDVPNLMRQDLLHPSGTGSKAV